MKTLLLLRHAKAGWGEAGEEDFDRPLDERGRAAAVRMGEEMRAIGLAADLALVSPAARAAETFDLLVRGWGADVEWKAEPRLYHASPDEMLEVPATAGPDVERLMLVGHNPGMYQLAVRLTAAVESQARSQLLVKYPTGALAEISLPIERWEDAGTADGTLVRFVRPRDLG